MVMILLQIPGFADYTFETAYRFTNGKRYKKKQEPTWKKLPGDFVVDDYFKKYYEDYNKIEDRVLRLMYSNANYEKIIPSGKLCPRVLNWFHTILSVYRGPCEKLHTSKPIYTPKLIYLYIYIYI